MDELRFDAGAIAASYTTPDGWERVYLRLARPNWDYQYFNRDGTSRIEVISPDDLFDKHSTDTAKMIPLGIGHPTMQRVDSFNIDHYLKGATGHTVLREKTADGEFLGITATIFSEDAKQAAKKYPGVSPGYSVKLARNDSQRYSQKDRSYNHTAVGVIPRGGAEVRAVFEGLRVDSADHNENPIWIAAFNEDCYAAPVDLELVEPLLARSDAIPDMAEKTKVDLNQYSLLKSKDKDEDDEEDEEEAASKKKKRSKAIGFGEKFKRKDSMNTTTFVLDGVTYQEVPIALAQAIAPVLKRTDSLAQELEAANTRADELETKLSESEDRADGLEEELATAKTQVDELESEDGDRTDEDESLALALDIAATVDQMRSDGLMLQDLGLVENFNTDFAFIADNMGGLQKEMLGLVYPNQRTDSYDDAQTAIAYDTAMGAVRTFAAQQRVDAEQEQSEDRQDMYYPDMGYGRSRGGGKPKFNQGLPTLHKIGQMSRPMRPTNQTVGSLLRKFEKMEDAVFEEASNAANQRTLHHPMAAQIM